MSDQRLDTLARIVVDKREAKDEAVAAEKLAKKEYASAEADFWETMDDLGLTTFTADLGDGYGKVQIQRRETVRGIVIDKEAAVAALREMGLDEGLLGTPEIGQAALSEHARDWLASGQQFPEGIDFTKRRYIALSRK